MNRLGISSGSPRSTCLKEEADDDEVEDMHDAAHEGRHGPRDEAIVTVLYDTGLRRGELAHVDREMLDFDEAELPIPPRVQKDYPNDNGPDPATFELDQSGDLHTIRVLRALLDVAREGVALFPSQKTTRMTGKGINDVFHQILKLESREVVQDGHTVR